MTEVRKVRRSNIPMILMIFAVVVFGIIILYSVSGPQGYAKGSSMFYVSKQIWFTVAGLIMCLVVSFMPINFFKNPMIWGTAYVAGFLLIVYTALFGTDLNGAQRWISIGSDFMFQPSEVVKISTVLSLAGYRSWISDMRKKGKFKYSSKNRRLKDAFFDFILPVAAALIVDIFILAQPHLSCFLIVGFVTFMCMINSGISWKSWVIGGGVVLVFAIAAGLIFYLANMEKVNARFAHVFQRLDIYAAQSGDESIEISKDESRQVDNAHNALGSGGLWGRGLGNSRAKYNYVSEAQNDYIFSIYVEETGFVGGALLILMYMIMFAMCFMVILRADSVFSRMIATGCTSLIMIQVLFNIAVELQVLPSTGVTLPFVSYGGTAQVFLLIAYGMILCVSRSGTVPAGSRGEKR